jgi:hypothetical protein
MKRLGRLEEEGSETAGTPWSTNIIPHQMTRDQQLQGLRWLYNNLYHPAALTERISSFVARLKTVNHRKRASQYRPRLLVRQLESDMMNLIVKLASLGPEEARMCSQVAKLVTERMEIGPVIKAILVQYAQIRYMAEKGSFWAPQLVEDGANKRMVQIEGSWKSSR